MRQMDMKLCLGTAQFGLDYGVNNARGKIPQEEIFKILNFAHDNGIHVLDTASAYGDSESVLGRLSAKTEKSFHVITKYPANTDIRPLECIDESLRRLNIEKVYGYLFHNYSVFHEHPGYIDDFVRIKAFGKSEKIGFSLYYTSEAEYILENDIPCDIVQVPYSIFDQRFAPLFPVLKNRGIEVYARSIFLQGLFFIDPSRLDSQFDSVSGALQKIRRFAEARSVSVAALCLACAHCQQDISHIVIGVDSLDNLKNNIADYALLENLSFSRDCFEQFAISDENIILPLNWRR
jgi:aryl-alcohol dehydrogenase-like predicted oxidoreductase